jgi:hypothetical protein
MWRPLLLLPGWFLVDSRAQAESLLAEGTPAASFPYAFAFLCIIVVMVIICMPSRKA